MGGDISGDLSLTVKCGRCGEGIYYCINVLNVSNDIRLKRNHSN
jgi:hypothetical protein